jgi:hypothetical protein
MIWNLPPLPANPLDRFVMLLRFLVLYVGCKHRPDVDMAVHTAVWWYVDGVRKRFTRLVERFRAGALRPPRPRAAPRAGPAPSDAAEPRSRPHGTPPRDRAYLCWHVPQHAAWCGGMLRSLLEDPEVIAVIEAGPQARRVLRPLFRMLGHEMPAILLEPPRAPPPPTDPAPLAPPAIDPPAIDPPAIDPPTATAPAPPPPASPMPQAAQAAKFPPAPPLHAAGRRSRRPSPTGPLKTA